MYITYAETGGNIGNIYLSADNPIARPPSARIKGTQSYNDFTPAYNCTVPPLLTHLLSASTICVP